MGEWQVISTAPKDGSAVWIAVKPCIWGLYKLEEQKKIPFTVCLVRYDTWNHQWRLLQSGEAIQYSKYHNPEFWQPCPIPVAPGIENVD